MQIIKKKNFTRIQLTDPSKKEINDLQKTYEFHELILEDLYERNHENKTDMYDDDTLYISLNFLKYTSDSKTYIVNPFQIIVGKGYVITIGRYVSTNIDLLVQRAKKGELDDQDEDTLFDVVYEVLNTMYDKTIKGIKKANQSILLLQEDFLHTKSLQDDYLSDLIIIKLNLLAILHTFRPQREILSELNKGLKRLLGANTHKEEEYALYIDDLDAKLDKIIHNAHKLVDTLSLLSDSYDTMMSIRTNKQVRILTIITAITGILTLVVGAYGMNVQLPFQESPAMFWVLMVVMGLITFLLLYFLKKK